MLHVLNVAILGSLIKLLVEMERPLLPAAIYGVFRLLVAGLTGASLTAMLVSAVICFAFVLGWFWVLSRIETATGPWWLLIVIGTGVGFFLGVV
jgi:hypothetical protein